MKRHGSYGDPRIKVYPQTEHMAAQKLQYDPEYNNYAGKVDSFLIKDEHTRRPSNRESRWQYPDGNQTSNTVSSYPLSEDLGRINDRRSYHEGHFRYPNMDSEKQANPEALQAEQDMEIGYEDSPAPLTYEGLERKFNDEILRLVKEQNDLEDTENARHKERLMEINTQYQQQLSCLRIAQAARRQEFLDKESQARLYQYQNSTAQEYLSNSTTYTGTSADIVSAAQQYSPISPTKVTPTFGNPVSLHYTPMAAGEATRFHKDPSVQFDPYRQPQGQYHTTGRNEPVAAGRVPYPEGRVYNTGHRYH